jgi:ADP-ribosylglycohydrolase
LEIGWVCKDDVIVAAAPVASQTIRVNISGSALRDKIEGYWVGQCVGNYVGWPFEFKYNDQPMPRLPDRYHDVSDTGGFRINQDGRGKVPETLDNLQGAFTDDDTDIEFVTLHAVELHGLDITYEEIGAEWKEHINDKIWVANKRARELMGRGITPPTTGMEEYNKYWWAIDPQLVNEIWSAFYPGMLDVAVERAGWAARITNSHWGTHPTLFYAALYSGAFFTSDVQRLYDIAASFIPESSPFAEGLRDVRDWHTTEADWRKVWWRIKDKYLRHSSQPSGSWADVSSLINGVMGAMAFLYGEGDFIKTVGIATAAGFDCDNQAATLGGLIGVMHGSSQIPRALTHDVGGNSWAKAFNDIYVNNARDGLPEVSKISDIVNRILRIAHAAILQTGGATYSEGDETIYEVLIPSSLMDDSPVP